MDAPEILTSLVLETKFGWQGIDVVHFDADGEIKGKFTYAWYGTRPYLERKLG